MNKVYFFDDDYSFLSNMFDSTVEFEGLTYLNSESAYQSCKCKNLNDRKKFINISGKDAKRLGRTVKLRDDWEHVKDEYMYQVCKNKFIQNPVLKTKLKATSNMYLEEGNTWGDTYWSTVLGKGQNRLGLILILIRENECN